jgi:hypothetical protein
MAELRIKIELNRGRVGMPLDKPTAVATETVRFNQIANDKLQDIVDSSFKLYKQITDNAEFAEDLLSWMFERYLKVKRPDNRNPG